jgi:exoribonuclease R
VGQRFHRLTDLDDQAIASSLANLRDALRVKLGFEANVLAEADQVAANPRLPDKDLTEIPLVTIDPPQSKDLDQALYLKRRGGGYLVYYAIADVGAFVKPGGEVDQEAHRRGQTLYAPDGNARLHPPVISEGAASLLPQRVRPALVWHMYLEGDGEGTQVEIRRALVRSRAKLSYQEVQAQLDAGTADDSLALLREVGVLRQEREARLGGINLPIPEQVVTRDDDGYRLELRSPLPVEGWNAQISLMAGQAAAEVMLEAEVGVLRTLPRAGPTRLHRLRLTARALGIRWERTLTFAELIRSLDPSLPNHAALVNEAAALLRGSGYSAFDDEVPTNARHAGVGAEYAHATAPLRRLVDRYVGEVCVSVSNGVEVPEWVRSALPTLPEEMERSTRRAQQYEAGIISTLEAAVLRDQVGELFPAVVVDVDREGGVIQLIDLPVTGRCRGTDLPLGKEISARLVLADVSARQVAFELGDGTRSAASPAPEP